MQIWKCLQDLNTLHNNFLKDTFGAMTYNSCYITMLPSFMFVFTNFLIIYSFCHRYTRIGFTSFRIWLFRELTFHWIFFYVSKMWIIFMRIYKLTVQYICDYGIDDRSFYRGNCYLAGLLILTMVSTLPLLIYTVKKCSSNRVPNFLVWIGEDPWLNTEIGLAGHYLERPPPRFSTQPTPERPYRTKRSLSVQTPRTMNSFIRVTKSAGLLTLKFQVNEHTNTDVLVEELP